MGKDTDRNFIEHLTWDEVARRIAGGAAAILPIGAAAKQHGFHLPLNTDRMQAEWFSARLAERFNALIWPTLSYGHYPAFTEYAGSEQPVGVRPSRLSCTRLPPEFSIAAAKTCSCSIPGSARWLRSNARWQRLDAADVSHLRIYEGPRYCAAAEALTRTKLRQPRR